MIWSEKPRVKYTFVMLFFLSTKHYVMGESSLYVEELFTLLKNIGSVI